MMNRAPDYHDFLTFLRQELYQSSQGGSISAEGLEELAAHERRFVEWYSSKIRAKHPIEKVKDEKTEKDKKEKEGKK